MGSTRHLQSLRSPRAARAAIVAAARIPIGTARRGTQADVPAIELAKPVVAAVLGVRRAGRRMLPRQSLATFAFRPAGDGWGFRM